MRKLKIFGAGSIGNHLAHAGRSLGWQVVLCDVDDAALERTRREIYPGRYGRWDEAIQLCRSSQAPRGGFDLIAVGTPPDSHVALALEALAEEPRSILVEKPLCPPALEGADELAQRSAEQGVRVFVGYDHVVARSAGRVRELAAGVGSALTLDVEFREHWGGIFAAHPWLSGPQDSYLGFWRRGGGASGEHSHALHLWQSLAHHLGAGRVAQVTATLDYARDGRADYDRLCLLQLRTEGGLVGRVVQDVVTAPPRKWGRVQGTAGFVAFALSAVEDRVEWKQGPGEFREERIAKTRPDDFLQELRHVDAVLEGRESSAVLDLDRGLETALVVAAAHRSSREARSIRIDWDKGWTPDALQPA